MPAHGHASAGAVGTGLVFRQDSGQFVQMLPRPLAIPTPEVTPKVTPEVQLAGVPVGEMKRQQLQLALGPSPNASRKPAKGDINRTNETWQKPEGGHR